jgi:hypothetical protein
MKNQQQYRPNYDPREDLLLRDEDLAAESLSDLAQQYQGEKGPVKLDKRLLNAVLNWV